VPDLFAQKGGAAGDEIAPRMCNLTPSHFPKCRYSSRLVSDATFKKNKRVGSAPFEEILIHFGECFGLRSSADLMMMLGIMIGMDVQLSLRGKVQLECSIWL
jgi:hypothetical protein